MCKFRVIEKKTIRHVSFTLDHPFSSNPLAALSLPVLPDAACVSMNGRERVKRERGDR